MSKGSDSREFFEIFKPPQKMADSQKEEVKTNTESAEVSPQSKPHIPEDKSTPVPSTTTDPLGWIKKTRAEDIPSRGRPAETPTVSHSVSEPPKDKRVFHKDDVVLRQETLIIGAIAATFLSIACFFVGHKVGYNKGVMHQEEEWLESTEPQDAKKTAFTQPKAEEIPKKVTSKTAPVKTEKQVEPQKPVIRDKWTLRLVSYKNTKENVEKAKELAKAVQNMVGCDAFAVNTGKEVLVCVGEFEEKDGADLMNTQKTLAEFKYENKKQFEGCYPIRMR